MNRYRLPPKGIPLTLVLVLLVFAAGCATTGSSELETSSQSPALEGQWSWKQSMGGPATLWEGKFVLERAGDSYGGTLNDTREGTYGDIIRDVVLSEDQIKFTREGRFGAQYWKAKLIEESGTLKMVNGLWVKESGTSGLWYAEKTE
jgi:hypothetical protein